MPRAGDRRARSRSAVSLGLVLLAALVAVAGRAGTAGAMGSAEVVLDVGVGVGLGVAGLVGPGALAQRALVWSVGAAWLLASVVPVPTLHQGLLVATVALFPAGRPWSRPQFWVLFAAAPVTVGLGGQPLAGAAMACAGLAAWNARPPNAQARWFPACTGAVLGAALTVVGAADAVRPGTLDPGDVLLAYELALVGVAAAHVLAMRSVAQEPARRLRDLVSAHRSTSFRGRHRALEAMLADALRDPDLRLLVAQPGGGALVDSSGAPATTDDGAWRFVGEAGHPVAAVATRSSFVADPTVVRALDEAVALVARSLQLAEERERRLRELRAARSRLVEVARRERHDLAGRLRVEVLPELDAAVAVVDDVDAGPAGAEVATARAELVRAREDIAALLRGSSTTALGGGRLVDALRELADAAAMPVTLEVEGQVAAPPDVEAACYHVCAEALANAGKHSNAATVRIRLLADRSTLSVSIVDDGSGGADPEGTGLAALRERVLALGGRWHLLSPPGAGTCVTASFPAG